MRIAPLKYPKQIPDKLFYHAKSGPEGQYDLFNLMSLKSGKKTGFLVLQKGKTFIENCYSGNILFVNYIASFPTGQGYGQTMIDFAKKFSQRNGCNGHLMLKADVSLLPQKIPHLFYRKNNFTTLNKKIDKKMDSFIKKGKTATYKDFPSLIMYYFKPSNAEHKPTFFEKIKNLFRQK